MSLITCKECGTEISTKAKSCPKCGVKIPHTKWWLWIPLGLVSAFLAFGAMISNSPEGQEKAKSRHAIDYCWEGQKQKSLDPATQRFVAGACEKMERDFETQYGHRP